jgi:hypothetical protein
MAYSKYSRAFPKSDTRKREVLLGRVGSKARRRAGGCMGFRTNSGWIALTARFLLIVPAPFLLHFQLSFEIFKIGKNIITPRVQKENILF